jgi:hypothetical protein
MATTSAVTAHADLITGGVESREKFIENVKLIVKQSEMIKKHKINKSIFICRTLTILMFLFMSLFVLFFLHTIVSIWQSFLLEPSDEVVSSSAPMFTGGGVYVDNNVSGSFTILTGVMTRNESYPVKH